MAAFYLNAECDQPGRPLLGGYWAGHLHLPGQPLPPEAVQAPDRGPAPAGRRLRSGYYEEEGHEQFGDYSKTAPVPRQSELL